ncbi:MAG TPA: hypothetical protein VHN77_06200 [Phycisphaerales bacterium]|nr:hypothetical protein [Phycisphaerales bacterium]
MLVSTALERLGIDYFVTGSLASSAYGEVRFTRDVDFVVAIFPRHAAELVNVFQQPDFYTDVEAMNDVAQRGGMCNIIHVPSGLKADLIKMRAGAYEELILQRRRRVSVADGPDVWMISPEDLVLAKLMFYDEGRSQKHLTDIAGILRSQGPRLDTSYVDEWADKLDVWMHWVHCKDPRKNER